MSACLSIFSGERKTFSFAMDIIHNSSVLWNFFLPSDTTIDLSSVPESGRNPNHDREVAIDAASPRLVMIISSVN